MSWLEPVGLMLAAALLARLLSAGVGLALSAPASRAHRAADFYDRPLAYPKLGALMRERTEVLLGEKLQLPKPPITVPIGATLAAEGPEAAIAQYERL